MHDHPDAILLTWPNPALRHAMAGLPVLAAAEGATLDEPERRSVRVMVTSGAERIGAAELDALPNLYHIVAVGAGFDGVDVDAARRRGVGLVSGRGANADAVADCAVGLLLAAARGIVANDAHVRRGGWLTARAPMVRSVGALRVGVVGMGCIGRAIAARLVPFGCDIAWTGPRPKPELPWRHVAALLDLAGASDALVVAAPLNPDTRHLIDAAVMAALGPDGLLVNIGRGALVDEDALIAALVDGRLGGAALDVFAEEPTPPERWRDVPNVILSPHTAGVTHESMDAVVALAARRAADLLGAAPPRPAG